MGLPRYKKILIIDDERDFAELLKANLEQMINYEVVLAKDGREGLRLAVSEKPDLILLDVRMPGMDGLAVLKKLKADQRTLSIPVVMMTAVTDQKTKQEAGFFFNEDYVEKPIPIDVLKERLNKIFSRFGG